MKRANVPGTKEAELTKQNKAQITLWKNAASLGLIEADQEALKLHELNSGQSHRVALTASLLEVFQKGPLSQGVHGKSGRGTKKAGRGGGIIGTHGRGDFRATAHVPHEVSSKGTTSTAPVPGTPIRGQQRGTSDPKRTSSTRPTVWEILEDSKRSPPWKDPAIPVQVQRGKKALRMPNIGPRERQVSSRPRRDEKDVPQLADPNSFLAAASAQLGHQRQASPATTKPLGEVAKPQQLQQVEIKVETFPALRPLSEERAKAPENKTSLEEVILTAKIEGSNKEAAASAGSSDIVAPLVSFDESYGDESVPSSRPPNASMNFEDLKGLDFMPALQTAEDERQDVIPGSRPSRVDTATESTASDSVSSGLSHILTGLRNLSLEDQVSALEEQLHRIRGQLSVSRTAGNETINNSSEQSMEKTHPNAGTKEGYRHGLLDYEEMQAPSQESIGESTRHTGGASFGPDDAQISGWEGVAEPALQAKIMHTTSQGDTGMKSAQCLPSSTSTQQPSESGDSRKIADFEDTLSVSGDVRDALNPRMPLAASRYAFARGPVRSRAQSSSSVSSIIGDHQFLSTSRNLETGNTDQSYSATPKLGHSRKESSVSTSSVSGSIRSAGDAAPAHPNFSANPRAPRARRPISSSPKVIVAGLIESRWGKEVQVHSDLKGHVAEASLSNQSPLISQGSERSQDHETIASGEGAASVKIEEPTIATQKPGELGLVKEENPLKSAFPLAPKPVLSSTNLLAQRPRNVPVHTSSSAGYVADEKSTAQVALSSKASASYGLGGLGGGMAESRYADAWRPPSPAKSKVLLGLGLSASLQDKGFFKKENKKPGKN
ncbi:hypothetical protein L228DRAFT_259086 [Xylona heveae TC161]|uniref:Uncharacterized protein n=1 Tax=Xylona heveae (strain CBS 132557 / TC161) TaxID=1328760 RepID=A0A165J3Z0_XYLHT|nr:hypothetical protein L228DRAFT_259086 [Xylona heveae TC161]KZF25696.1 hypothetical protein L228DRAFT_259086 [Xylona heveae TC161]